MKNYKRIDTRRDADRDSIKLTVRLPPRTARQLEQLAKLRNSARVTVLCDLIQEASK